MTRSGESLFVTPDLDVSNGVDVADYDMFTAVIAGRSAWRYDYDAGTFKRARVFGWRHYDRYGTLRSWFPAGGTLADEIRERR